MGKTAVESGSIDPEQAAAALKRAGTETLGLPMRRLKSLNTPEQIAERVLPRVRRRIQPPPHSPALPTSPCSRARMLRVASRGPVAANQRIDPKLRVPGSR